MGKTSTIRMSPSQIRFPRRSVTSVQMGECRVPIFSSATHWACLKSLQRQAPDSLSGSGVWPEPEGFLDSCGVILMCS